jgi:radical SAM superfamily enzyme YgiQ (UPF0313 family)
MSDVLLVNPQMPFNRPIQIDSWIRMGLAQLSAVLKADKENTVHLLDLRQLTDWDEFYDKVARINPDVVFITAFTSEVQSAIKSARIIRSINPCISICVGGIHASIAPEDYQKANCFDFIVRGEGEITVPKIAAGHRDVISQTSDWIYGNPITLWGETPDLDKNPFPDRALWEDFPERMQYPPAWLTKKPWAEVLMARGCPYHCKFCCGAGEQNHYTKVGCDGKRIPYIRGRSVENVIVELQYLVDTYGTRSIHFSDDQFILNPEWTRNLMMAMQDNGLDNLQWWAGSRADVILRNKELVLLMRDCGMDVMSVGFESFSYEMLKFWNKGTTVAQNFEAAQFLNDNGIKIFSNVIMGAPRPDGKWHIEDDERNIAAMKQIHPFYASWSIFTAVPGSELYRWCVDNNLIADSANSGIREANENKMKGISYRRIRAMMDGIEGCHRPWYHHWHDKLMLLVEGE